jgi:hypothetical protein
LYDELNLGAVKSAGSFPFKVPQLLVIMLPESFSTNVWDVPAEIALATGVNSWFGNRSKAGSALVSY